MNDSPLFPASAFAPRGRFLTMDALRGVAVMAILLANMPGFALPAAAYSNPMAWGAHRPVDIAMWIATEILVDGRMRGLFSLLFGASMLLVLQRADAGGENGASLHLRRMAVLFVLGLIHLTFIWTGDILTHYALVGMVALAFVGLSARRLLIGATIVTGLAMAQGWLECFGLLAAAARATPRDQALWNAYQAAFGTPGTAVIAPEIAAMRGPWEMATAFRLAHNGNPLWDLLLIGPETLGAMLLGMAAFKSGFLTGAWPRTLYRRCAIGGLALSFGGYAAMTAGIIASGYDVRAVALTQLFLAAPFRLIGTIGYAALIIPLLHPQGWWSNRIAAAGRMAFSNYIATSLIMTFLFYGHGLGQFGRWDRATLYLMVPPMWASMLIWSKPCIDRFGQGPLERLWRTIARARLS